MSAGRVVTAVGALVVGVAYWLAVSRITGTAEPWDARDYWRLWYPVALLLSAGVGVALKRDGWSAAAMLILAQLPVMWLVGGPGPLAAVGLLFAGVLALPAMALALLAGLARRQ